MALLFADGFDHYATADITTLGKWTANTNFVITAAGGRNATQCLQMVTNGANSRVISKTITPAGNANAFICGFGFRTALNASSPAVIEVMDNSVVHVSFAINSSGVIVANRGNGGTLLGTASVALTANTYYYIEVKVLISDTVGTVRLDINGTTVLSLTGQDTRNAGNASWTGFQLVNYGTNTAGWDTRYDDLYVCDSSGAVNNDILGPIRIVTALPDGAGATTQMTPSTGSNFQNVDDALQNGDTDYNSETTVGELDTYTFANLGVTGTVKGVQTNLVVRSDGAGSETVAPMVRIAGVNYAGTAVGLSTAYLDKMQVYETSPATTAAWTVAEIDGAEFGVKLVS